MDFNRFIGEREPRWKKLGEMLDRVDNVGLGGLKPAEVEEFFALYRLVSSDLNIVQTRTGNPALLDYLEGLVGRAFANLAPPPKRKILGGWWRIVRHKFPATIRAERFLFGLAALTFVAGSLLGFGATYFAPQTAEVFLPAEHLVDSPKERVAKLEEMERKGETRISSGGEHAVFTTFLFTHNIRVSVLCLALGFTFGVGTVILLFLNGAMLGSLAALYLQDGVMTFFVAWIGPHGSIEIPCVLFAATGGLMIARAQLRRDKSFRSRFREVRPMIVNLIVGAASLLVIAGVIEGGFSQVNEPTLPYFFKTTVAVGLFTALLAYLFRLPVDPLPAKEDADEPDSDKLTGLDLKVSVNRLK